MSLLLVSIFFYLILLYLKSLSTYIQDSVSLASWLGVDPDNVFTLHKENFDLEPISENMPFVNKIIADKVRQELSTSTTPSPSKKIIIFVSEDERSNEFRQQLLDYIDMNANASLKAALCKNSDSVEQKILELTKNSGSCPENSDLIKTLTEYGVGFFKPTIIDNNKSIDEYNEMVKELFEQKLIFLLVATKSVSTSKV
jgi:hypothetical protein